MKNFLYWAPRILCMFSIVFISLFSLDVFFEGYTFWQSIGALFIHLIPSFIMIVLLLIAWRWELPGGLIFVALGVYYTSLAAIRGSWSGSLIISIPVMVTGALFIWDWYFRKKQQPS